MIAINVAQLLKSPVGDKRSCIFSEVEPELERTAGVRGAVQGQVQLTRTGEGILAEGTYETHVEIECSRCVEPFLYPVAGTIEEEFLPSVDIQTGAGLETEGDADQLRLTRNHVLELNEVLRQDVLVLVPLQPLCRPSCNGLCPDCGAVRDREACSCPPERSDSPFSTLADLLREKL